MFILRDSGEMTCKSMDDKQGNHSPGGVIIELKTNEGNTLPDLMIILFPFGNSRETLHSQLSYNDSSFCIGSFKVT